MNEITNYVTGDFYEGDSPDEMALGSFEFISKDLNDIKRSYFRLGFHLNEFDSCKYYQQFGFTCLSDFALHNWGLEKSFVSRCISVFKFTAKYSGSLPTMYQEEAYKPYSYSQLVEMISMDGETLRKCSPTFTVKELRQIKKNVKKRNPIATSQSEKNFDYEKYILLHGAARSAYIKSCDALGDFKGVFVVDSDGKEIPGAYNTFCEVLQDNSDRIVVRLCQRS